MPAIAGPRRRGAVRLTTPDGVVRLPIAARAPDASARRDAVLRRCQYARRPPTALALLLEHGIVGPQDLPLRIIPTDAQALDGWRFR